MNASPGTPPPPQFRRSLFLEGWLAVATWLSLTGWILSLLGALNRQGYLASLIIGAIVLGLWLRAQRAAAPRLRRSPLRAWRHRIRQPLPAIFALIFTLAALGGALYPPNNFDALTYRLPQLLHWLDAGRWHWIAASDATLNITPPGYGWLMAPLLALTGSDRGFFLPNVIAFALLPGSFFTIARGCGVRSRVAWAWMWILPSGYCFAMQAGSIANDLLPASYLLAAVALALRARRSGAVRDAWFSILAAALATGIKVAVLPLGLPWIVALAPSLRLLLRRPLGSLVVILSGMAISFIPTAILNAKHSGDWSGDPTNSMHLRVEHPLPGIGVNALIVATSNLAPPIWPFSARTNSAFEHFKHSPLGQSIRHHFPRFDLRWFELPAEDGSGVGPGIFLLGAISCGAALFFRGTSGGKPPAPVGRWICLAAVIAMLAYGAKMGSEAAARLIVSYYAFLLLPLLRLSANDRLARTKWWRALAVLVALSIVPALILTPARPLWPAQTILARLTASHPDSPFLQRSRLVYEVYAQRYDYLAPLKKHLPVGARTVGFVPTGNDLEGSLWRPFGSRRVVEVLAPNRHDDAVQQLAGSAIVSSRRGLRDSFAMSAEQFASKIGGRLIAEEQLTLKASVGPEPFVVIAVD